MKKCNTCANTKAQKSKGNVSKTSTVTNSKKYKCGGKMKKGKK